MKEATTFSRPPNALRRAKAANRPSEHREKLMMVGARFFVDRGIARVSVEELVDEAGVSRATFYGFFANKYELAAAILLPVFDSGIAGLSRLGELPPRQAAEGLVDVYLFLWEKHRDALLLTAAVDGAVFPYIELQHERFGAAFQKVLRVIESGGLLRNDSAELTYQVLAKTGIPLLRVYQDHDEMESVYRDSMLALLVKA